METGQIKNKMTWPALVMERRPERMLCCGCRCRHHSPEVPPRAPSPSLPALHRDTTTPRHHASASSRSNVAQGPSPATRLHSEDHPPGPGHGDEAEQDGLPPPRPTGATDPPGIHSSIRGAQEFITTLKVASEATATSSSALHGLGRPGTWARMPHPSDK